MTQFESLILCQNSTSFDRKMSNFFFNVGIIIF